MRVQYRRKVIKILNAFTFARTEELMKVIVDYDR